MVWWDSTKRIYTPARRDVMHSVIHRVLNYNLNIELHFISHELPNYGRLKSATLM